MLIIILIIILILILTYDYNYTGKHEKTLTIYAEDKIDINKSDINYKILYHINCVANQKFLDSMPTENYKYIGLEKKGNALITFTDPQQIAQAELIFHENNADIYKYQDIEKLCSEKFKENRANYNKYFTKYHNLKLNCIHRNSFIRFVLGMSVSKDIDLVCDTNIIEHFQDQEIDVVVKKNGKYNFYSIPEKDVYMDSDYITRFEDYFNTGNYMYYMGFKLLSLYDTYNLYHYRNTINSISDLIVLYMRGYTRKPKVMLCIKCFNEVYFNYPQSKILKKLKNTLIEFYNLNLTEKKLNKFINLNPSNENKIDFGLPKINFTISYLKQDVYDLIKSGNTVYVINCNYVEGEYVFFKDNKFSLITFLNYKNKKLLCQIQGVDYFHNGIVSDIFRPTDFLDYNVEFMPLYMFNNILLKITPKK